MEKWRRDSWREAVITDLDASAPNDHLLMKTERGKDIYAMRKETIERIFADAKEKRAMRYTHPGGLTAVTRWVRLKYAAMNLKRWLFGVGTAPFLSPLLPFYPFMREYPGFSLTNTGIL